MSREKQIEEMEKVIADAFMSDYNIGCDPCTGTVATALYLEGYRKQSDVIDEFAERLKEAPIKCGLPLFGLTTKTEIEEYFDDIMLQVRDAIISIAKDMKGGAEQ